MLIDVIRKAWLQVLSPAFRRILWRSLALTLTLLVLVWLALTRLFSAYLGTHTISGAYPILDTIAFFLAGAGLFVALAYILPAVSALVASYFLDEAAERIFAMSFMVGQLCSNLQDLVLRTRELAVPKRSIPPRSPWRRRA